MPAYRAEQILDWVYGKNVADPTQMTNLSRRDRETITRELAFLTGDTLAHQRATDGVQKLLLQWSGAQSQPRAHAKGPTDHQSNVEVPPPLARDPKVTKGRAHEDHTVDADGASDAGPSLALGALKAPILESLPILRSPIDADPSRQTECVLIPTEARRTACISSQVGCPVGCKFCASGLGGLDGNLSAGRIVEQVWRLAQLPGVGRISNVVFMGMGEPLANFDNVKRAIETIAAPWGMNISARKITVSTVGLPKYIERLARELDLPVTLALSLHAPTDDLRRSLIPWSEFTTIADLLDACRRWFEKTGREITLEYTLMREINDRPEHARALARLAKTMRSNVNLIRYNEVESLPYRRPHDEDVRTFQQILRNAGVTTHIRASRGRDIAAACGQLRHETAVMR